MPPVINISTVEIWPVLKLYVRIILNLKHLVPLWVIVLFHFDLHFCKSPNFVLRDFSYLTVGEDSKNTAHDVLGIQLGKSFERCLILNVDPIISRILHQTYVINRW